MLFLIRKLGKLLRGNITPFQIIAGCVLGAMLGFMPGFSHAPGLIFALSFALLVINGNLLLAGFVGLAAKLLSFLLLPVSYYAGRALLDGPTEGLFQNLINAPIFALFGFENYVTTGGLLIGGLFGLIAGMLIARSITAFRTKMAGLNESSPRYQEMISKKWMKLTTFIFVGGGSKKPDYAALLAKKTGNPIRILGVVLVVLSLILGGITYQFFSGTIVTTALRSGLEEAVGATVDLERAEIDLAAGRMTLNGIAAADPNALDTDIFRAEKIEADISVANLLRKRLQLDRVVVTGATSGEQRKVPGKRTVAPPKTSAPIPVPIPDTKSIEDYFENAKIWRDRLALAKKWMDKISGPPSEDSVESGQETLEERLQRIAEAQGYASLNASHLIEGAPTFLISELQANKVTVNQLPGEVLNIVANNLSTQPGLASGSPKISITSASDKVAFEADFGGISASGGDNALSFHYRGLPVDQVMGSLKSTKTTLKGGTIDLAASGRYFTSSGAIDLPLEATLNNTIISLGGRDTKVSTFSLPIGLTGQLDNPRIKVDAKSLGDLAIKAGTDALKEKATEQLKEKAGGLFNQLLGN